MFIIIIGRWILPKGNISHSALSQLLLVYLSLASDILDLLTLFNEQEIQISRPMVHLVLIVFSCCMLQFALNLTATRGRSFHAEFDQSEIEIHQSAPSEEMIPLEKKPLPRHRQILSKILRPKSSSTTRPIAPKRKKPMMKINSRSPSATPDNEPDTIFLNPDTRRGNDRHLKQSLLGLKNKSFFVFL